MARFCIFLINLYRRYISRYTRPTCRFSPTCSTYALESYKRFGFFLGTYLTVKRLLKLAFTDNNKDLLYSWDIIIICG